MSGAILLLDELLATPAVPRTTRRFTVWGGSSIAPHYRTVADLAAAAFALVPPGQWDEVELLLKAGEGGTWQAAFDRSPLAPSSALHLATMVAEGAKLGLRISPYVVVRARDSWIPSEQSMVKQCVAVAKRCVLNVEPGAQYYNGRNEPSFIRNYLHGMGVDPKTLEVCMIPRHSQVDELGGPACLQAWTDPTLVGSASWETYDVSAPGMGIDSLRPDVAIPRLDVWGVPQELEYRICVVQRSRVATWAPTIWAAQGLQAWFIDGD